MESVTADIFNDIAIGINLEVIAEALNAHAVVAVTSLDGNIIHVNQLFCQLSGYSEAELRRQNHRLINSGHDHADFFADLWQVVSIGNIWRGEIQNRAKNGSVYWMKSTVVPIIDSNGYPEKYLTISTDITQQKNQYFSENQQRRFSNLFRQVLQGHLIDDDLVYSSSQLLSGLMQLCSSQFGFIGRLLSNANSDACLEMLAIEDKAWDDATNKNYQQQLTQGLQLLRLHSLYGDVIVYGNEVVDNNCIHDNRGCGFTEDVIIAHKLLGIPIYFGKKLLGVVGLANKPEGYDASSLEFMRPFVETCGYLLSSSESKCMDYASNLVISDKYKAVQEQVKLPPLLVASSPITTVNGYRILVAEDNPANQAVLKIQLQVLGMEADIVSNGLEAQQAWKNQNYHLLLTDLNMPVMDGVALANSIRLHEHGDTQRLPIIAISANSENDYEAGFFKKSGIDDILVKPIELDKLRQILDKWLPQKTVLPIAEETSNDVSADDAISQLPILDCSVLVAITGVLPLEQIQHLVRLFIDTAQTTLTDCQQHLQNQDTLALALAMHKLKSSAQTMGAIQFTEQAKILEQQAKAGFSSSLQVSLAGLFKSLDAVIDAAFRLQADTVATSHQEQDKPKNAQQLSPEAILAGLRNNEFEMYFQPRVDAQTLQPVVIEALARWHHQGEIKSADAFIFAAESYGLINQLSEVLFIKAFVAGARLGDWGFDLPISINLPLHWLTNSHLFDFIQSSLYATGFNAEKIILTIDESTFVANLATALPKLQEYQQRGFRVAINHFSANALLIEQLPPNVIAELKIDKQMLLQLATHKAKFESVLATIKNQQCQLIAKGIETEAELLWAKSLGVDFLQGWVIAEPMLADALMEWLEAKIY